MVVLKLNALVEASRSGDIPQNVNFAIKASMAMSFLDGAGIDYQRQEAGQSLETPAISDLAQGFTFLIECRN